MGNVPWKLNLNEILLYDESQNTVGYGVHLLICLILGLFWQRNPHQSEGMAYASQLLFPHGSDLCCVCRRHQSNQIPHHLSSSKCIPFSFIPLSKLFRKLIMNVYSGVSDRGPECSMWTYSNPALCLYVSFMLQLNVTPGHSLSKVWAQWNADDSGFSRHGCTHSLSLYCPVLLPRVSGGRYSPNFGHFAKWQYIKH